MRAFHARRFATLTRVNNPHTLAQHLAGQNLVGGRFVKSTSSSTFEVRSPATGELIAHAAASGADDVNNAVAEAKKAYEVWMLVFFFLCVLSHSHYSRHGQRCQRVNEVPSLLNVAMRSVNTPMTSPN
jgi:hypothetical protein